MLTHSKLQSIIWTSRIAEAETFYRDVLGLTLRKRSDGALVFDVGGGDLSRVGLLTLGAKPKSGHGRPSAHELARIHP